MRKNGLERAKNCLIKSIKMSQKCHRKKFRWFRKLLSYKILQNSPK